MARNFCAFVVVFLGIVACTRKTEAPPASVIAPPIASTKPTVVGTKIVFLGDSLTEGLGVTKEEAFPALVANELRKTGRVVEIVNSGISGSTSASGPGRMKWLVKGKPAIVVVALGANDGLRGFPAAETKKNLTETVRLGKEAGVKVLLAGMEVPPNYGDDYAKDFRRVFREVSVEQGVPLLPFLLDGVAGEPELNISDRIHPNPKGHEKIAKTVLKYLEPLL